MKIILIILNYHLRLNLPIENVYNINLFDSYLILNKICLFWIERIYSHSNLLIKILYSLLKYLIYILTYYDIIVQN